MASAQGQLRIRNQRYPRWVVVAENVFVAGLLVAFLVIENLGLWLLGQRTTVYILLACLLAISPVVIRGWLLIWDLNRAGPPGRGVTARALYEGVFLGIRRKELAAAIGWTALTSLRAWLPAVHTVSRLKLGDEVEPHSAVRFPAGAVRQVRFAPEPDEDYRESEPPLRFCEATIEVHSGRRFRLIVDEADAKQIREWAEARGITVADCNASRQTPEPASQA
ncbi:MAG: hypothetical protein J2P46_09865 [Zavarzinella sp.]|nr:hypothetical protein [Zavarzinella sp.]